MRTPAANVAIGGAYGSSAVQTGVHAAWLLAARVVFGGYFLFSGISHFLNVATMAGYAGSKGVPLPQYAVLASGTLIALGGLSLILGAWPRIGASLIMLFLIVVTPMMHDFWRAATPAARMNDFAHFLKNVALLGGACFAMALPEPWPASVGPVEPAVPQL